MNVGDRVVIQSGGIYKSGRLDGVTGTIIADDVKVAPHHFKIRLDDPHPALPEGDVIIGFNLVEPA